MNIILMFEVDTRAKQMNRRLNIYGSVYINFQKEFWVNVTKDNQHKLHDQGIYSIREDKLNIMGEVFFG